MSGASVSAVLNYRTHYSLGESVMSNDDVIAEALNVEAKTVAVCDTMNLSCMVNLTKKAKAKGVRVIVGVRLRIVPSLERDRKVKKDAVYVKAFARNEKGMQALYKLLSIANDADHFFELPRLVWDDLKAIDCENLVFTTGDFDGVFSPIAGRDDATKFLNAVGGALVFAELVAIDTPYFDRVNAEAIMAAQRHSLLPLVAAPALYKRGDFQTFLVSMAIHKRSNMAQSFTIWEPTYQDAHAVTSSELVARAVAAKDRIAARYASLDQRDVWKRAILNTDRFTSECAYEWSKQPVELPNMAEDPDKEVARLCSEGLKARLFAPVLAYQPSQDDIRNVYLPRLKYELGVLKALKFAPYFLLVSEIVNAAKADKIAVGPGRGSVGGSLVAYLMGITDVDPIRFGLLFERFINPSRNDLPDADLDFMSSRREDVIKWIEKRWGSDYVAGISNYGELGSSSSLRDVGRIYGKSVDDMAVAKVVPKVHGQPVDLETAREQTAAIDKWAKENEDIWKKAVALQGSMRSYGKHAAGIIVAGVPIVERAVVELRSSQRVINWDMSASEDTGLVKLDVLGLSTLDTISRCMEYIRKRYTGRRIDMLSIPLDDPETLQLFATGKTQGIFQFEGGAARRILKDMARTHGLTFDDLVAANALNRPGPIEAGLVDQYVRAKNGDEHIELAHPNMAGALAETFNVIVYQEQVMRISVDLCGFDLSEADKLRKAMGKKDPVLMASFREKFVNGANSHSGMDPEHAGELFDQIELFAGYAFNKSHSVEYSLISYQMAWLKTHYPIEFFAAALSTVKDEKLGGIVADAARHGITILPPDINISSNEFEILNDTTLVIPFNRIKGVSDLTGASIMKGRALTSYEVEVSLGRGKGKEVQKVACTRGKFDSVEDLRARTPGRTVNSAHMDRLERVGAFARIVPGARPAMDDTRRRDQHELMPGLIFDPVMVDREIPANDKAAQTALVELLHQMDAEIQDAVTVRPVLGKQAKFMAVYDSPSWNDEANKRIGASESFEVVRDVLDNNGMKREHGYWTAFVKRAKKGAMLSTAELTTYAPYFERELEILRPPLIITFGSNVARYLVPDIKGNVMDHVGKLIYDRKRDCNILIGFNPGMCFFDAEKIDILDDLFARVASLVL